MNIIISNRSELPIYQQIKEQIKEQILAGIVKENEMLPSLRQLARELRISVLTTTRAYNELEQEGYITSQPGKGFFVLSSSSELFREQLLREIEEHLALAIQGARRAKLSKSELHDLLRLLLEVEESG